MSTYRDPRVESMELIDPERLIFKGVIGYDFRNQRGAHTYLETYHVPFVGNPTYGWIRADGGVLAPEAYVLLLDEASKAIYLRHLLGEGVFGEKYAGTPVRKVLLEKNMDEIRQAKQDRREDIRKQRLERMKKND